MKCAVCGAPMQPTRSDLPFKTTGQAIVILKGLPVLQCENCAKSSLVSERRLNWRSSGMPREDFG